MKGERNKMKPNVVIALSAALLAAASLVAENATGFENFVLSRNDGHASVPAAVAGFSSRTRTKASASLKHFSSRKPAGEVIVIR